MLLLRSEHTCGFSLWCLYRVMISSSGQHPLKTTCWLLRWKMLCFLLRLTQPKRRRQKKNNYIWAFMGFTGRMGMVSGRRCFSGPGADDRLATGLRSDGRPDRPPFSKGKRRRSHGSRSVRFIWSFDRYNISIFPAKISLSTTCCHVTVNTFQEVRCNHH